MLQHPQFTLTILDPTSLLGGETVEALWQAFPAARRKFFHTTGENEHLVTEAAGEAALVPPLVDAGELDGSDVIVATAPPAAAAAAALFAWLRANPGAALIDGTGPGMAPAESVAVFNTPPPGKPARRWYLIADPALWGPGRFIQALAPVRPRELHMTLLLPVSEFGEAGVDELVKQAAARLSGRTPRKPETLPAVLAFDLAPAAAARRAALGAQLRNLLPGMTYQFHAIDTGIFHGHAAAVAVRCEDPADAAKVATLLRGQLGIRLARRNEHPQPSAVVGSSEVVCTDLDCGEGWVTALVVADGLRVGGAQAIADVLAAVRAS